MADFPERPTNAVLSLTKGNQIVEFAHFERAEQLWCGVRHIAPSEADGEVWETAVVCHSTVSKSVVSIRLDRTSVTPKKLLRGPKTPYVVRNILDEHSGGLDGAFAVQRTPHFLGEGDVQVAVRIMRGESNCSLPVVYLSAGYDHLPSINAKYLASWLGGMAHVLVEPSRHFSRILARDVSFANPHSGAVAVFWPHGSARPVRCAPDEFDSPTKLATRITHIVRDALTVVRQPPEASWGAILAEISRANIEKLRSNDTLHAEKLVEEFDSELKSVREQAASAEREVERLRRELQRASAQAASSQIGVLKQGKEQPFYLGEIEYALTYALQKSLSVLSSEGRFRHIVESVIEANQPDKNHVDMEKRLDDAISSAGKLESQDKRALEKLGFVITEEGKHIKMVFHDDDRYTFVASKTPSDHRSMKNFKAQLARQLCK